MNIRTSLIVAAGLFGFISMNTTGEAVAQINNQQESIAGGVAGAIIGGIVGHQNDETAEGVAIGGVAGAIAGNLFGKAQDRRELEQYQYQQAAYRQQQQIELAQQQVQEQQFQRAISIEDAIALSQSGVGSQLILNQIQANGVQQEIGVSEIILLSQNGVNEVVIDAMQRAGAGGATSVVIEESPVVVDHRPVVVDRRPVVVNPRPVVVTRPTVTFQSRGYGGPSHHHRSRHPHHARGINYGPTIRIR